MEKVIVKPEIGMGATGGYGSDSQPFTVVEISKCGKKIKVTHDSYKPAANFIICVDENENLFLQQTDSFELSGKRYGDNDKIASRILNTFNDRKSSTGALLVGEKGSVKTLLAKTLSAFAIEAGVPTILINSPWKGDKFSSLIQNITQPCVILFDEFEKVYNDEDQHQILTLMDGVYPTKKLFVLTCNDKWKVDKHMKNRPGRIFYFMEYKGLEEEFIREYCNDNLNNKEHLQSVVNVSVLFPEFNFDMLKGLVEEMNRYKEDAHDAMKLLNINPEFSEGSEYIVTITEDGELVDFDPNENHRDTWSGNPLSSRIRIGGYFLNKPAKAKAKTSKNQPNAVCDDNSRYIAVYLEPKDLIKVDMATKSFAFKKDNKIITLTKKVTQTFDYRAF